MVIKVTLIIVLVLYIITLAENLVYRLVISKPSFLANTNDYIRFKEVVDRYIEPRIVIVYFILLAVSMNLVAFCCVNPNGFLFRCSILSFVLLVFDIVLLFAVNIPMDKKMKKLIPLLSAENWECLRRKSNRVHRIRRVLIFSGFVALIVGTVFGL